MNHIAIIGGGAAGLMCAATLVQSQIPVRITLYEKNKHLGVKVIISGGGRCNVTTAYHRKQDLQPKYIRGRDLISHAISKFGPRQIMKRFQSQGVALKTEVDMRVFPVSDDGHDIVRVFELLFESYPNLEIKYQTVLTDVTPRDDGRFDLSVAGEVSDQADKVVIATGGNAYRQTGSTGDGYYFAQSCGHTMTALGPSLNSFHIAQTWLTTCSGISLTHARCHRTIDGKKLHADGPLLLTHFGISGPLTFVVSAHLAFETIDETHPIDIRLQCFADRDIHRRQRDLQQSCIDFPLRHLKTYLGQYLSDRLVIALCQAYQIDVDMSLALLSKGKKQILTDILGHGIHLSLLARRAGDEFVTAGGVPASQIDPETLESIFCPGLYFAGEVMDVDGVTGGYNLTASRASARLVGTSIVKQYGFNSSLG